MLLPGQLGERRSLGRTGHSSGVSDAAAKAISLGPAGSDVPHVPIPAAPLRSGARILVAGVRRSRPHRVDRGRLGEVAGPVALRLVEQDGDQPGPRRSAIRPIPCPSPPGPEQRFLHHVLGSGRTDLPNRQCPEHRQVRPHPASEVPGGVGADELRDRQHRLVRTPWSQHCYTTAAHIGWVCRDKSHVPTQHRKGRVLPLCGHYFPPRDDAACQHTMAAGPDGTG